MDLKEKSSARARHWKVENMKAAVDEWANHSAQQLENRLGNKSIPLIARNILKENQFFENVLSGKTY